MGRLKRGIFMDILEENRGITLIEVLISLIIFVIIMGTSLLIFKGSILNLRKENLERKLWKEAVGAINFIEKYIRNAMVNDLKGKYRMNFYGGKDWVKFIAPFSEGEGSDLGKFGIYQKGDKIKASFVRITKDKPDFEFFQGYPGSQILAEGVEELRFYYFDSKEWKENWSTDVKSQLPEFIKVEITLSGEKVEGKRVIKKFTKIVKVRR